MNLKLKRTPGIYIVGFMGSGKTTIGRMFADEIGWRFGDLDEDIEHAQRRSVSEIFSASGEEEFRRVELEALQERVRAVCRGVPTVLALGGGAFTRPETIKLLHENGITVWIDTAYEVVRRRVQGCEHRPLARDMERFERLYRERREFYAQAEFKVTVTSNDSRTALTDLLKLNLLD